MIWGFIIILCTGLFALGWFLGNNYGYSDGWSAANQHRDLEEAQTK